MYHFKKKSYFWLFEWLVKLYCKCLTKVRSLIELAHPSIEQLANFSSLPVPQFLFCQPVFIFKMSLKNVKKYICKCYIDIYRVHNNWDKYFICWSICNKCCWKKFFFFRSKSLNPILKSTQDIRISPYFNNSAHGGTSKLSVMILQKYCAPYI